MVFYPDPCKIDSIMNLPQNIKGLRAFLALTGYYRKFSPTYVEKIQLLLELAKKGVKWKWQDYHQKTFDEVKALFVEEILCYIIPERRDNLSYMLTRATMQ